MTATIPGTSPGETTTIEVDDIIGTPDRNDSGLPKTLSGWASTTDHKAIGVAYAVTALVFLGIGGILAGVIRAELAEPGLQFVDESTYNSLFTIHGSVMVYLFAVPFAFGNDFAVNLDALVAH